MKSTRRNFLKSAAAVAAAPVVRKVEADACLVEQEILTDAQIKELGARTERLQSGDAVINEDLTQSLDSEIGKVMTSILEEIQKRAIKDNKEFLPGSSE